MVKNGRVVRYLDIEKVDQLGRLRAKVKSLRTIEQRLSAEIRIKLKRGYICPSSGPWIAELNISIDQPVDWRLVFFKYLRKHVYDGDGSAARQRMNKIKGAMPSKEVVRVLLPKNPKWKKSVERKKAA